MSDSVELDSGTQAKTVADYVNDFHVGLDRLIRKQFWSSVALIAIVVVVVLGGTGILLWFFQEPPHPQAFSEIRDSNTELARMSRDFVQAVSESVPTTVSTALVNAIIAQSAVHENAISEVERAVEGVSAEGLTWLQLLGGSVIVVLIGYLGLQRLQNIDAEIQNLREFMFKQIKERMEEGRQVLVATIDVEVDERFKDTKDEIASMRGEFADTTGRARTEFDRAAADATISLGNIEGRIKQLLEKYSWLEATEARSTVEEVSALSSVEEAHSLSSRLFDAGDRITAKLALRQILDRSLKGSADSFHNVHTQAFMLDDTLLALDLVNEGLRHSPDQYDLMADKARVLINNGQAADAVALIEEWMDRKPEEFVRGWRPFVFWLDAVCACELTLEKRTKLDEVFTRVSKQTSYEDKIWSNYARFHRDLGDFKKAEEVCLRGIDIIPFSQELNFTLGMIYLRNGRGPEAVARLESALKNDVQEQFQFDVDQDSLLGGLGQAYEATNDILRAAVCYQQVVMGKAHKTPHIAVFAAGRLRVIEAQINLLRVVEDPSSLIDKKPSASRNQAT